MDPLRRVRAFRSNVYQQITSADISPDGRRLATGDVTGTWQIWDTETGAQLTEVRASSKPLSSVLFTSDGLSLITAGDEGVVRAWQGRQVDPTIRITVPMAGR
jgi:WD40 repeat protein